jgi:hypothetical protein
MNEIINEIKKAIRDITGHGEYWGGRTTEINARVARLMGQTPERITPHEEYAACAKLAKSANEIR